MGQRVVSWLICNGRFRVHAINGVGERKSRIIEVEEVATGERAHGSSLLMEWLTDRLAGLGGTVSRATTSMPGTC